MQNIILILRPLPHWDLVGAELRHVESTGRYMSAQAKVRPKATDDERLLKLATICEQTTPDGIYLRYANRQVYKTMEAFWNTDSNIVSEAVKLQTDRRLSEALRLAADIDIPVIYAPEPSSPLHIDDRLCFDEKAEVEPVMNFVRHTGGITYTLHLRIDGEIVEAPGTKPMVVIGHNPALFILGHKLMMLREGFSGKLLKPFCTKETIEIPERVENSYFRKFILRNVTRAEINAEGFDIIDTKEPVQPRLRLNYAIDGRAILSLSFRYGQAEYRPEDKSKGNVVLRATDEGGYQFIRQMRDNAGEQRIIDMLQEAGAAVSQRGDICFASTEAVVEFLREHSARLRQHGVDVMQPSDRAFHIGPMSIEQSDTWNGDWLQTRVVVVIDNGRLRIPFVELRNTILSGGREYLMSTGERLLIPEEWLKRYSAMLLTAAVKGEVFTRHRSQLQACDDIPRKPFRPLQQLTPPAKLCATLRPYQQRGYEWLWRNFEERTGCCLADEMGLGKTVQTIAMLLKYKEVAHMPRQQAAPLQGLLFSEEEMRGDGPKGDDGHSADIPFRTSLVVAPASVVPGWGSELKKFAPSLLTMTYTGDVQQRQAKRQAITRWDVVITTYGTLARDIELLASINFGIVVFDESQAFKNHTSQIYQAVARLRAVHSVALSGTPVENSLHELWSLMSIINPGLMGTNKEFGQHFVKPIAQSLENERTEVLARLVNPYFLKRRKDDVLSDLPMRQDETVVCPLTAEQQSSYAAELSKARNEWLEYSGKKNSIAMMQALQRLRMIANGEGKMTAVMERLAQLRDTNHKVLIFSEYVTTLDNIALQLCERGWDYDMLTGKTTQREKVIRHFQDTDDCQFFLISLKAGGVGLNLTAADYVFVIDPWWNLAAEEQAIARSHRIGQQRPVFVYRFVAENTIEQQILTLQDRKQDIIEAVMPFIGLKR